MSAKRLAVELGRHTGVEAQTSFKRLTENSFFARFLSGKHILDVGEKGHANGVTPILPHAVSVDLDYLGYDGKTLPFPDESQDAVFSSHALERIADYRRAIAEWFRVLRVGGFLVIAVPHQFLFERKLSLPSRFNVSHKRFYTAASLLLEIEEALDPHVYRVRYLEDNDVDFDYSIPPENTPAGCYDTIVVLERIHRPDYADAVLEDIQPKSKHADRLPIVRTSDAADGPTLFIRSKPGQVQNILVMKLDHRGDFILAKPAMLELRRQFPSASLTLVCGQWNAPAAAGLEIYDDILTFNFFSESGAPISKQRRQMHKEFAAILAGRKFDLAIDLRVDSDTRDLLTKIESDQRAGFGNQQQFPFLDIALPFVNPTVSKQWHVIGPGRFKSNIGALEDFAIAYKGPSYFSRASECLICCPEIDLEPGSYRVEVDMAPSGWNFSVGIKVSTDHGTKIVKEWQPHVVRRSRPVRFNFYLKDSKKIEIGIFSRRHRFVRPFAFTGCRFMKRGEWHGPHQQELMYMLACVAGLRMKNPYKTQELGS